MTNTSWLVIALTIALGLATLTMAQVWQDSPALNTLVLGLGAAILSVGISLLIIEPLGISSLSKLMRYVTKLDRNPLMSPNTVLESYKGVWHSYRVTEDSEGVWRWIYTRFDMSDAEPNGWLMFDHRLSDSIVEHSSYSAHCFVASRCLFVFHKSKTHESEDYTEIYPLADQAFDSEGDMTGVSTR